MGTYSTSPPLRWSMRDITGGGSLLGALTWALRWAGVFGPGSRELDFFGPRKAKRHYKALVMSHVFGEVMDSSYVSYSSSVIESSACFGGGNE